MSESNAPLRIVWFKRDLRADDHAPLAEAAEGGTVLPLYIAEPALWTQPVASARQWRFVAGALADLRERLAALGAPLVVRTGDAVEVLETLRRAYTVVALHSHQETGNRLRILPIGHQFPYFLCMIGCRLWNIFQHLVRSAFG